MLNECHRNLNRIEHSKEFIYLFTFLNIFIPEYRIFSNKHRASNKRLPLISAAPLAGADPEIFKRGGALCQSPWLTDVETFRFQMV